MLRSSVEHKLHHASDYFAGTLPLLDQYFTTTLLLLESYITTTLLPLY